MASGVILLALVSSPIAAGAATQKLRTVTTATTQMYIAGFDVKVAEADGYVIKTDAAGNQYSVPLKPTSPVAARALPANTLYGNCGSSYVSLAQYGSSANPTWDLDTGFTTKSSSVDYHWYSYTITSGDAGTFHYEQDWSGGLWFDKSWHGHHRQTTYGSYGDTHANVKVGSYAILDNGGICYSGGPTAYIYLY